MSFDPGNAQKPCHLTRREKHHKSPEICPKSTKKIQSQSLLKVSQTEKNVFPCAAPARRQDLGPQEPGLQCCLRHLHGRGTQGHLGHRGEHHFQDQGVPGPGNDHAQAGDSGDRQGDHGHLRRRRRDRRDQGRDRESVLQARVPRAHRLGKCQGVLREDGKVLKNP